MSNQIESDAALGHADSDEAHAPSSEDEHLDGVEDGCGCTEVWEHLSEQRDDGGE